MWCCFTSLKLWRIVSLKRPNYRIPPEGFDPSTSKLWAWRSAAELRGYDKCCAFMTQESFLENNQRGEYRRQVSILWPSAYKAITIHKADYKVNEGANDVLRRSAAELHRYNVSWTGSGTCSKCLYALVRFDDNTGNPFRSGVLKVMSLARFLCAMPVNVGECVDEYFLRKLLIHIYI